MNKWGYSYLNELRRLWEKEKLLLTSNFSFSHNVFKSCLILMRHNEYLWSKRLRLRVYDPKPFINKFMTNFRLFQSVHQNINSRDMAVLLLMLSLLPSNVAVLYPTNHWLFIQQKTYSCSKIFVHSSAAPAQIYAKPNSNPNLSPSSAREVPLPGRGGSPLL